MNKLGSRSVKLAGLIATAAAAVIGTVAHTSAGAPLQWYNAGGGCYVLSDDGGYTSYEEVCSEGNGNYDVYTASNGQWVFSYQIVTNDWSLPDESPQSNPFDPNATGDWGQNMSTGATPTTENGFDVALSAALALQYGQPVCAQVIGDICYLD